MQSQALQGVPVQGHGVPVLHRVPTGTPRLEARVNFERRQSSCAQTGMALVIWIGTLLLVGTSLWSAAARNVKLQVIGACDLCEAGYTAIGNQKCPKLCVATSLERSIQEKCLQPPASESSSTFRSPQQNSANATLATYAHLADSPALKNKSLIHLLASPVLLPVFLPLLLAIGILWFSLLRKAAHICVWSTVVLFLAGLVYGYYLTRNWMMLVIALVCGACAASASTRINKGCSCLQVGLGALSDSPFSLLMVASNGLLLLAYTGLLMVAMVFTSQVFVVNVDGQGVCDLRPVSARFSAVFVLLWLLTSNFFTMVLNYSIAYAIGCWYFHQGDGLAPDKPMVQGIKFAITSRNGTGICAQAALLITVAEYMERRVKKVKCPCLDPLWCLLCCLHSCFHRCLRSLCSFALVAVALDGGPFCETSKRAVKTLGPARAARFLVIDSSVSWLLKMQAQALSTFFGIAVWAAIDFNENLGIFHSIATGAKVAGDIDARFAHWIIVLTLLVFFWFMRRPLFTSALVMLLYLFLGDVITNLFLNSALAALLVGSVGSLVFHQFAEAASGTMASMLYCWMLEEAVFGIGTAGPGVPHCREQVCLLWESSAALAPSAPPLEEVLGESLATVPDYSRTVATTA